MPDAGSWSCRTPGAGHAGRRELVMPRRQLVTASVCTWSSRVQAALVFP